MGTIVLPKIRGRSLGQKAPKDRLNRKVEFKDRGFWDEFPTDFWNYRVNPISGFPPEEVLDKDRVISYNRDTGERVLKHKY